MNSRPEEGNGFHDASGAVAVVALALLESLLLLSAQQDAFAFGTRGSTQWYTLAIALPTLLCLLLRSARDRYAWACVAALLPVLMLLAGYSGAQCVSTPSSCDEVFAPYTLAMGVALFVLLPFLQAFRDSGRQLPYALLFHRAWDNALALAAALLFTGAGWLILWLWGGLFSIIGIEFFKLLFREDHFAYPVTGLLAGLGIALGRTQSGALRSLLHLCLALGRVLLPLIAAVALMFLAGLLFTGLQPLWDTRHATPLLLCLVFGTVALVNSVFQDGDGDAPYGRAVRSLLSAALLTLPVYATIAVISLRLRVLQHGWSVDRLWAALLIAFALLYALGYAAAALRRGPPWLQWLAPVNRGVALLLVALLLLAQSPLLDFRRISAASQLERLEDGRVAIGDVDFRYFRHELGRPGLEALQRLQQDPRVLADAALKVRLEQVIAEEQPGQPKAATAEDLAALLSPRPRGQVPPAALLQWLAGLRESDGRSSPQTWPLINQLDACRSQQACFLLAVDLDGDGRSEWVLASQDSGPWPLLGDTQGPWQVLGYLGRDQRTTPEARAALRSALEQGEPRAEASRWKELVIGGERFRFRDDAY